MASEAGISAALIRLSGFYENGFHGGAVEVKIQSRGGGGLRGRAGSTRAHPNRQRFPLRLAFRFSVLASSMEGIATRFGGQRMHQQATRLWIPWDYYPLPGVEILARLLFVPVRCSG